jgi:hypothetical protein
LARFGKYYQLSCDELAGLGDGVGGSDGDQDGSGFDVPRPERMILGHSHRPRAWDADNVSPITVSGRDVYVYNTGGWLRTDGGDSDSTTTGRTAELFILKDGALTSERV